MLMDLNELLAVAKTPEERKEIKASILAAMNMTDEDIDYSDIPEVTDFRDWQPAAPYLNKIAAKNREIRLKKAANCCTN